MHFFRANFYSTIAAICLPFILIAQPIISSFTPISGKPGDVVTLTGNNFNTTPANNIVFFGATRAMVSAATATSVTATVPVGATYAPISLLNTSTGLAAYSLSNFTPTFSPAKTAITANDFLPKQDFTTGNSPYASAIGDLDGDGKPDLVVANADANSVKVSVFRNTSTSGSIGAGSFAAKVDFETGNGPSSIAIGDLDGDGKPDLAIANFNSSTVSVLRNTSSSGSIGVGSFATKVDFTTGPNPRSVAIGDLDGDGKPDLVVANVNSYSSDPYTVSVFRNTSSNGNIDASSFAARQDFETGVFPTSVAIGDLDGDGKPELAIANNGSSTVSVFRNTSTSGNIGAGSFAAKVDFTTGPNPWSVAIGDLDGDGKPDLVVTHPSSNSVSVFRNTSSSGSVDVGSFEAKQDFATSIFPISVAIGDLDGDGKSDLAVTNVNTGSVSVFRNTSSSGSIGAGSFASRQDFATGSGPISVAIGDLDGDEKPDLAVANYGSNTVSVLRNADIPPTISSFTPISGKPGDVVTLSGANFNTTAASNVVFFGATSASVTAATDTTITVTVPVGATYAPITLLKAGTGLAANSLSNFTPTYSPAKTAISATDFLPKQDFTTGNSPYASAIGDLDGDGKPDLAVVNYSSNSVSIYRNITSPGSIGASSFAVKEDFTTGSNPYSVAIGDLDGDGKPDLVVSNHLSSSVSVFHNTSSTGSIGASSFSAKVDFTTGANPASVAIGDLDGDGKPDLAVTNFSSNTVSVLRNVCITGSIGASSFSAKVDFTTGANPASVAISDLDGDGKPDLAVANNNSSTVSVFRNTSSSGSIGTGSFAAKVDFATGSSPRFAAIGDLDGDGKPDLAVASSGSHTVSVFRNTSSTGTIGTTSFAGRVDFATGTSPRSLAIGDLDGDGKPDLAVSNNFSRTVSVLRNTSSTGSIIAGSFEAKVDFATGFGPFSVAIGDLDGDGKPDLAVANNFSSTFSVLRNADVYTFTGSGNWDNPANWSGGILPPSTVPAFVHIIIDPTESGECILNVPVTVPNHSSIKVAPGKKFVIQGNLTISNQ